MAVIAFILFSWTAFSWWTSAFQDPFLGISLLQHSVWIPFSLFLLWSGASLLIWGLKHGADWWQSVRVWIGKNRKTVLILALLTLLFIVSQIPAVLMYRGVNNADTGVWGVASYHIADGQERPLWFYGQHYNGTVTPHIVALLNMAVGKHPHNLRIITSLEYLAAMFFVFAMLRRLADTRTALIAFGLLALPPYFVNQFIMNTSFGQVMLFGAWSLWQTVRILDMELPDWRQYFWLGALSGIGFFIHLKMVFFILPILGLLFIRDKLVFIRPRFLPFIPAFALGSIGTVIDSYYYDFTIFTGFFGQTLGFWQRLLAAKNGLLEFLNRLPLLLGAAVYPPWDRFVGYLLLLGLAALTVRFIWQHRNLLGRILRFENVHPGMTLFFFTALAIILIFSISKQGQPPSQTRYIGPFWLAVVPLIAWGIARLPVRRGVQATALMLAAAVLLTSWISFNLLFGGRDQRMRDWEAFAREQNITRYYGDFWMSNLANFFTREQIIGSSVFGIKEYYRPYYSMVRDAPGEKPFFFRHEDGNYQQFVKVLQQYGIGYRRVDLESGFWLMDFDYPVHVWQTKMLRGRQFAADLTLSHIAATGLEELPVLVHCILTNTGPEHWTGRPPQVPVELVVYNHNGEELHRQFVSETVKQGEQVAVDVLLDARADPLKSLLFTVEAAGIRLLEPRPLVALQPPSYRKYPVTRLMEVEDLTVSDPLFSRGWVYTQTPRGIGYRIAVEGESHLLLPMLEQRNTMLQMVVAPYLEDGRPVAVPVQVRLNGTDLQQDFTVDSSRPLTLELPARLLTRGLNRLQFTYPVAQEGYTYIHATRLEFVPRRAGFSISRMSVR